MKRKNISLILAVLMTLSIMLGGCGTSQEEVAGTVTPAATEAGEERIMSIGRIEGGTYTNNYVGFAMDLDSSWTYYSAEELQELPENMAEIFEGSELGDTINPMKQFTDMLAENIDMMATINVLYQKLDMQGRLAYALMDEEEILDAVMEQSDEMIEAYAQAGMEVSSMEKVAVTFLGEAHMGLKTASIMEGVPYYTLQLFVHNLGEYSATITFASFVEDQTDSLVALCYPISE